MARGDVGSGNGLPRKHNKPSQMEQHSLPKHLPCNLTPYGTTN